MSDEENSNKNNQEKKEQKIKIELNRSEELESLYQDNKKLERENAILGENSEPDYKAIFEKQAVEKFNEECSRYGLDPSTTKPEVLKAVREIKQIEEMTSPKKAPKGGETSNFYDLGNSGRKEPISGEALDAINTHSDTVSIDLCKWSSESAMIRGIKAIAANSEDRRQREAKKLLSLLAKKLINEPSSEFEYNGKLSDLQWKDNKKKKKGEFVRVDKRESD